MVAEYEGKTRKKEGGKRIPEIMTVRILSETEVNAEKRKLNHQELVRWGTVGVHEWENFHPEGR